MTLQAYEMNMQYQKTQLNYEMSITPVNQEMLEKQKELEELDGVDNHVANLPVVFANESDLSSVDKIRKMLMQQMLATFESQSSESVGVGFFPAGDMNVNKESHSSGNPYNQNNNALPQGFMYSASSEYYEKTTIEFSGEAIIKTPNGEYKVALNFSYTQEFYEKNETQIALSHENLRNPLEIDLDEDDESLKDLKSLHFLFDLMEEKEEKKEKDMFEQIREALKQRREMMLELLRTDNKEVEKNKDKSDDNYPQIAQEIKPANLHNFQLWQQTNESEFNLVAAQKDGVGVFFANASENSSYFNFSASPNGISMGSGYSHSETSVSYTEIKA